MMGDAARAWGSSRTADSFRNFAGLERKPGINSSDLVAGDRIGTHVGIASALVGSEVGQMPFAMDVPIAHSSMPIVPNDRIPPIDSYVAANTIKSDREVRDAVALMDSIETDRIPCPRLCGAVFSSGVGGIAGMCVLVHCYFNISQCGH